MLVIMPCRSLHSVGDLLSRGLTRLSVHAFAHGPMQLLREADQYIEIVDPDTAQPAADGTCGEVVVTTLTREAMPLVRFRAGHRAAVMLAPCSFSIVLRRLNSTVEKDR